MLGAESCLYKAQLDNMVLLEEDVAVCGKRRCVVEIDRSLKLSYLYFLTTMVCSRKWIIVMIYSTY